MDTDEVIPPQYTAFKEPLDFRSIVFTHNRDHWAGQPVRGEKVHTHYGKKRRREADEVIEPEPVEMTEEDKMETRSAKRQAFETNTGKVSGRSWKLPARRHTEIMEKPPSLKKMTWDQKKEAKAKNQLIKDHIKSKNREALQKAKEERERVAAKQKLKEENRAKSAILQKMTNMKKVKKMSKKQLKSVKQLPG
ncbi:hypothetical protein CYMTET_9305 [Cymbomonas tetramitiformis]|uniref:Coiled-coil domain-containing protein 86 n=1 Tax=Cymbomonas tetramitiformis TaxID=36881 RepID=A0AAE0GRK8_9CHLO|nr:hypothetical protein CYMTET_9305 [Cymbomonas tetramitiformis]